MDPLHIAHLQAGMSPEHGGPTKSLSNYCQNQAKAGHRVSIWTLEGYRNASAAIRLDAPVENHVYPTRPPLQLGRSPDLRRALRSAESPDVFHLHGAWSLVMAYGASEALRRKRPYVVELMGMYESWCLGQKWLQKRILREWFQDRILRHAACLHVNSQKEGEELQAMGFHRPIAVIPVGVDVGSITSAIAQLPPEAPWPEVADRKFILYFSRIHPKKGLDLLIRAWEHLAGRFPEWRLVIAGTGDQGYIDQCLKLAEEVRVAGSCVWTGHVDEPQKTWLLSKAHCYVLPTHSENFGNTVAEALAHRTPVITTVRTPWSDLAPNHCGWQVADAVPAIQAALEESMNKDAASRKAMGDSGLSLVTSRYSLESVTKDMLAVYAWARCGGPKPECMAT